MRLFDIGRARDDANRALALFFALGVFFANPLQDLWQRFGRGGLRIVHQQDCAHTGLQPRQALGDIAEGDVCAVMAKLLWIEIPVHVLNVALGEHAIEPSASGAIRHTHEELREPR